MDAGPLLAAVRRLGVAALDTLLPPSCMACDVPVSMPFQLCVRCFAGCHFITAPMCARCGVPFAYDGQRGPARLCPYCAAETPAYRRARAVMSYDTHSKPLLLQFKYADRTELSRLFAPMLARAGAAMLADADLLVPVPLHPRRLRQRGYNQAALLCRSLAPLCTATPRLDALQRVRHTRPLGELAGAARRQEMGSAIRPRPKRPALRGQRIVLVDDVMTSGATADACARALLDAGAAHVDVLVVARVTGPASA